MTTTITKKALRPLDYEEAVEQVSELEQDWLDTIRDDISCAQSGETMSDLRACLQEARKQALHLVHEIDDILARTEGGRASKASKFKASKVKATETETESEASE